MNVGDEGRLHFGLYELLHSRRLPRERFPDGAAADFEKVEDAERIRVLTTYVAQRLEQQLTFAKTEEQIDIINRALRSFDPNDEITVGDKQSIEQLVALRRSDTDTVLRPSTPLSDVTLLTNAPKQPSLSRELEHELASADRVDLLCSFLKLSGINVLREALRKAEERAVPVRIIATTYMGATDAKAVQALHDLGAEIKISYQNNTTRLHAKAWLFERKTGFSTGYVGSSNLSAAAMTDGLEWNVRLSIVQTPGALHQFRAAFDGYWNDPEFVTYSPDQYEQLDDALRRASKSVDRRMAAIDTTFLDVYARPHQAIMLDHLAAERSRGHHKNLVVAATGTGKTILSALDFKSLRQSLDNPTLLFIAHRTQILEQARLAFQSTLRDRDFGEMFADGMMPRNWKHVFASIQTLRGEKLTSLPTDHFDVVIIDEFHHASAPTYRKVIEHFTPRELVGLTATPERGDGVNVATEFFEGRIATELRLWDALDADLLVPFHYFGIKDDTDLSAVRVSHGEYDTASLESVYMEGKSADARLRAIFDELEEKVADPRRMTALGFCASKKHAKYMAEVFNRAGIPGTALVGEDSEETRRQEIKSLTNPEDPLAIIFTVDIFNEGIDIPEVDTILMLRPTQSPTLFQQQLGRGLRRSDKKAVLTVLDFVGNQSPQFQFDRKFSIFARGGILTEKTVKEEFPDTPAGCLIELDEFVQQEVINSLKDSLQLSTKKLNAVVADFFADYRGREDSRPPTQQLDTFLTETGRSIENIYRASTEALVTKDGKKNIRRTWTSLLAYSGVEKNLRSLFDEKQFRFLNNRIFTLRHVNDPIRYASYRELLQGSAREQDLSLEETRLAWMLVFSFWNDAKIDGRTVELDEALAVLRSYPQIATELDQVWEVVSARSRDNILAEAPIPGSPLRTHGVYTRDELYAGLGMHEGKTRTAPKGKVEGVLLSQATDSAALLVTLEKTEKHFSPQTMYRDYAMTPSEFGWDSQGNTTPESERGQIYQGLSSTRPLLFVRRSKLSTTMTGAAEPYMFLGPVTYLGHEGSQPMHVTWKLDQPMPAEVFNIARVAA